MPDNLPDTPTTIHPQLRKSYLILDESFSSLFSNAKQSILDVSDYEQADVIQT